MARVKCAPSHPANVARDMWRPYHVGVSERLHWTKTTDGYELREYELRESGATLTKSGRSWVLSTPRRSDDRPWPPRQLR